jgi:hypothetical protein
MNDSEMEDSSITSQESEFNMGTATMSNKKKS